MFSPMPYEEGRHRHLRKLLKRYDEDAGALWVYTKALIAFRENELSGKGRDELVKRAWKANSQSFASEMINRALHSVSHLRTKPREGLADVVLGVGGANLAVQEHRVCRHRRGLGRPESCKGRGGGQDESERTAGAHRPAALARSPYTVLPASTVARTFKSFMRSAGTVRMSPDSTTKSAYLPASIEPFTFSSKVV